MLSRDNFSELGSFDNDFERMQYLKQILTNRATGREASVEDYKELRRYFFSKKDTKEKLPSFVKSNTDLESFWQYIKLEFGSYDERRCFINNSFSDILNFLEFAYNNYPIDEMLLDKLNILNSEYVMNNWRIALERKKNDPDGAITLARTLLESVIKNILDELDVKYSKNADLPVLYKVISDKFNLSANKYEEESFRKILGGCSTIVAELGNLRNKLGDAHGKGKKGYIAADRHAELAVNLAGTMSMFLLQTYEWNKNK